MIPWSNQQCLLLQRNLVYTGITRGKQLVVVEDQKRDNDNRRQHNEQCPTLKASAHGSNLLTPAMAQDLERESNVTAAAIGGAGTPYLSKSKFLWGLQCPKLLWHAHNAKDKFPPLDAQTQAVFDQGHEVGTLAKKRFPEDIEIGDGITDLEETIRLTQKALKLRVPLFEAAFAADGGFCRVDILAPIGREEWDIVELMSTTGAEGCPLLEFLRAHFTDVPDVERQRVRRELEEYCGQDTEGMIWIVEALEKGCR
jgi:hypothetical protein